MERLEIFLEGAHEFTYTKEEIEHKRDVHSLYYSTSPVWSDKVRGEMFCKIEDDGSGYSIKISERDPIYLDYSEIANLKNLLDLVVKEPKPEYYKKVDL